jgi:rare lipoprotein A
MFIFALAVHVAAWGLLGAVACAAETGGDDKSGHGRQTGLASVYGGDHHRGKKTANGERVQPDQLTAAHRKLPFGTNVLVTNLRNGRSVVVRINDRGPFVHGRIIDVSPAAARILGFSGVTQVSLGAAAGAD